MEHNPEENSKLPVMPFMAAKTGGCQSKFRAHLGCIPTCWHLESYKETLSQNETKPK